MKRITFIILLLVSMVYGKEPNNIAEPNITIAKLEKELQDKVNLIARLREDLGKERQENERLRELCKRFGVDDSMKNYIPGEKKTGTYISRNAQSVNKQKTNNTIPSQVRIQIQQKAQSEWPNDYGMQKHTIENELEAYRSLDSVESHSQKTNEEPSKDVSSTILNKIKQKVMREYPDNYSVQEMLIESEVESYINLNAKRL